LKTNDTEFSVARRPATVSNHSSTVFSDAVIIEIVHSIKEIIIRLIDRGSSYQDE